MPRSPNLFSINVTKVIMERLKKRQHPGQSWGGVIEELLNTVEAIEKLPDVPKPEQR